MVLYPMERGVREDQIEWFSIEQFDVRVLEVQPGSGWCFLEHRCRIVDAQRLHRLYLFMERARQLAGAASEVEDAHVGTRIDERDEVPERLRALGLEFFVLFRRPRAQRRWSQFMIAFITSA